VMAPQAAHYQNSLGEVLRESGRDEAAIECYRRALALQADYPEAYNNLGNALRAMRRLEESIKAYQRALAIRGDVSEAHNNLRSALKDTGELDEALASFRQALALRPSYSQAHSNLVYAVNFHPSYDAKAICDEARQWARRHVAAALMATDHPNDTAPGR